MALRQHRLFDIERLANRSLTYLALTAVLVGGYAVLVAVLGGVLGLSGGVAAALSQAWPLSRWRRCCGWPGGASTA